MEETGSAPGVRWSGKNRFVPSENDSDSVWEQKWKLVNNVITEKTNPSPNPISELLIYMKIPQCEGFLNPCPTVRSWDWGWENQYEEDILAASAE